MLTADRPAPPTCRTRWGEFPHLHEAPPCPFPVSSVLWVTNESEERVSRLEDRRGVLRGMPSSLSRGGGEQVGGESVPGCRCSAEAEGEPGRGRSPTRGAIPPAPCHLRVTWPRAQKAFTLGFHLPRAWVEGRRGCTPGWDTRCQPFSGPGWGLSGCGVTCLTSVMGSGR